MKLFSASLYVKQWMYVANASTVGVIKTDHNSQPVHRCRGFIIMTLVSSRVARAISFNVIFVTCRGFVTH